MLTWLTTTSINWSKNQQTLLKMSVIIMLVPINNVINYGHYSKVATNKGVAFNQISTLNTV